MSRDEYSKIVGFPVGTRKLFERAVVHNEGISENNDSFFFYTRKIKESKFRYSEKEILECFLNLNLIVKLGDKIKNGKPIYALTESKLQACKLVGRELEINSGTLLTDDFPNNIRKQVTCSQHCKYCSQRSKVISSLNRTFNRKFCVFIELCSR